MHTTKQVANKLNITTGRVRQKAIALAEKGLIDVKQGRDWLFTDEEIQLLQVDGRFKEKK